MRLVGDLWWLTFAGIVICWMTMQRKQWHFVQKPWLRDEMSRREGCSMVLFGAGAFVCTVLFALGYVINVLRFFGFSR